MDTTKYYYTSEETKDFSVLLSTYAYKRIIIEGFTDTFKKVYEPLGRFKSKTRENGKIYWGVFDYNENGDLSWSHINKSNTNKTILTKFQNKVNQILERDGLSARIVFKENFSSDHFGTISMVRKFMRYIDEFRNELFDENGDFYKDLILTLNKIWETGKKYTNHFIKHYKLYVPEAIGVEFNDEEIGNGIDMFDGVDCALLFPEGKRRTLQIKGISNCELRNDEKYYITVTMSLKKYRNINAFVFYYPREDSLFIFKNMNNDIEQIEENGRVIFSFPSELLVLKCPYDRKDL